MGTCFSLQQSSIDPDNLIVPSWENPNASSPRGSSPLGSSPRGSSPRGSSPRGSSRRGSSRRGSSPLGSSPLGSSADLRVEQAITDVRNKKTEIGHPAVIDLMFYRDGMTYCVSRIMFHGNTGKLDSVISVKNSLFWQVKSASIVFFISGRHEEFELPMYLEYLGKTITFDFFYGGLRSKYQNNPLLLRNILSILHRDPTKVAYI